MDLLGLVIAVCGGAMAVFLCGVGSSIGVGLAGQAANGVLSENPERFGNMLLLVALPGTQGIYGFLSGFLVIMRLGLLTQEPIYPTVLQGWQIFGSCLPIAISGLVSAIHQGKVCAAGIAVSAKHPEANMRALTYAALVETYAALGLVITALLLLRGLKL